MLERVAVGPQFPGHGVMPVSDRGFDACRKIEGPELLADANVCVCVDAAIAHSASV